MSYNDEAADWLKDPSISPWRAALDQSSLVAAPEAAVAPPLPLQTPAPAPVEAWPRLAPHESVRPEQPAQPLFTPPSPAATSVASPPGTAFAVNDPRATTRPDRGWRRLVYAATAGRWNPGLSAADEERHQLLSRVRTHLPGTHRVVVLSLKGGIGKTTVTAGLGLTLAEYRGDRIIALDANPDAGTLADRLTGHVGVTVRDLLNAIDSVRSLTDVAHYTSLAGRLAVLASEQDPAMSAAFSREEYQAVVHLLGRYHNVLLTDSGTGLVHSAMGGALALADTLVIVGAPTVDGASRASKTLDWLIAHGYGGLAEQAVVALCHDRTSRQVDSPTIHDHFASRCRAVVDIPADPHLRVGGQITLPQLRQPTRDAFLLLAAHIGDQFNRWPASAEA